MTAIKLFEQNEWV